MHCPRPDIHNMYPFTHQNADLSLQNASYPTKLHIPVRLSYFANAPATERGASSKLTSRLSGPMPCATLLRVGPPMSTLHCLLCPGLTPDHPLAAEPFLLSPRLNFISKVRRRSWCCLLLCLFGFLGGMSHAFASCSLHSSILFKLFSSGVSFGFERPKPERVLLRERRFVDVDV